MGFLGVFEGMEQYLIARSKLLFPININDLRLRWSVLFTLVFTLVFLPWFQLCKRQRKRPTDCEPDSVIKPASCTSTC